MSSHRQSSEPQPHQYFAHSTNGYGKWHKLAEHLVGVSKLASRFAEQSSSDLKDSAFWAGLLHDLGKYRDEFQEYLRNEREGGVETHHAIYGAAVAFQRNWLGPAFAIAGHHAGLHDLNELLPGPLPRGRGRRSRSATVCPS